MMERLRGLYLKHYYEYLLTISPPQYCLKNLENAEEISRSILYFLSMRVCTFLSCTDNLCYVSALFKCRATIVEVYYNYFKSFHALIKL